jgi:hypothetical protein
MKMKKTIIVAAFALTAAVGANAQRLQVPTAQGTAGRTQSSRYRFAVNGKSYDTRCMLGKYKHEFGPGVGIEGCYIDDLCYKKCGGDCEGTAECEAFEKCRENCASNYNASQIIEVDGEKYIKTCLLPALVPECEIK